jgi:predicted dehydrogenase
MANSPDELSVVRIGMLSFWHLHGKDYALAAQENPNTEIVAVWDENPARGKEEAERLGVEFIAELDDLLGRQDIDAVVVDTPTSAHRDVIIAAAKAGKHIFTEKVIAATVSETEQIVAAVEEAGVTFMVSMWRSDEGYAHAVKDVIDRGTLGTITQVRVRDGHPLGLPTSEMPRGFLPEHFYNVPEAQGGALIDLCHPVYLVSHFLGLPESVSATFGYVTEREVEDNAVVTFSYANGAIGIAETSYVTGFTPFSIEVHGTEGSLLFSIDGIGELVARRRGEGPSITELPSGGPDGRIHVRSYSGEPFLWSDENLPTGPFPKAFEQWVTRIQAGETAPANVALGVKLSTVIEAAYLSALSGAGVRIDSLEHAG